MMSYGEVIAPSYFFQVIVVVNAIQSNALLQIQPSNKSKDIMKILPFDFRFVHQSGFILDSES